MTHPLRSFLLLVPFAVLACAVAVAIGSVTLAPSDIVAVLAVRTGKCAYHIDFMRITEGIDLKAESRDEVIETLLGRYVQYLEQHLECYPLTWFNFFDFWKGPESKSRRRRRQQHTQEEATVDA